MLVSDHNGRWQPGAEAAEHVQDTSEGVPINAKPMLCYKLH